MFQLLSVHRVSCNVQQLAVDNGKWNNLVEPTILSSAVDYV